MIKTFFLYSTNTINSTITIGTNGLKLIHYNHAGIVVWLDYILFDNIRIISEITSQPQEKTMSFQIKYTTYETPTQLSTFDITMHGEDFYEVYKLLQDGFNSACFKKDKIIGII